MEIAQLPVLQSTEYRPDAFALGLSVVLGWIHTTRTDTEEVFITVSFPDPHAAFVSLNSITASV